MRQLKNLFLIFILGASLPFFAYGASNTNLLLFNPLPVAQEFYCATAYCDLESMFLSIIHDFLAIIPVVSVLFIIIGGYKLVISSGNEEKIAEAKRTILWAILGLVISLLSFSLVAIVENLTKGHL